MLEPFAQATQELTSEAEPTWSCTLPVANTLFGIAKEAQGDKAVVKKLKAELRQNTAYRFDLDPESGEPQLTEENKKRLLCTLCDPR